MTSAVRFIAALLALLAPLAAAAAFCGESRLRLFRKIAGIWHNAANPNHVEAKTMKLQMKNLLAGWLFVGALVVLAVGAADWAEALEGIEAQGIEAQEFLAAGEAREAAERARTDEIWWKGKQQSCAETLDGLPGGLLEQRAAPGKPRPIYPLAPMPSILWSDYWLEWCEKKLPCQEMHSEMPSHLSDQEKGFWLDRCEGRDERLGRSGALLPTGEFRPFLFPPRVFPARGYGYASSACVKKRKWERGVGHRDELFPPDASAAQKVAIWTACQEGEREELERRRFVRGFKDGLVKYGLPALAVFLILTIALVLWRRKRDIRKAFIRRRLAWEKEGKELEREIKGE